MVRVSNKLEEKGSQRVEFKFDVEFYSTTDGRVHITPKILSEQINNGMKSGIIELNDDWELTEKIWDEITSEVLNHDFNIQEEIDPNDYRNSSDYLEDIEENRKEVIIRQMLDVIVDNGKLMTEEELGLVEEEV